MLGIVAVALLAADSPGASTHAIAAPWILAGLGLRAWAFGHLGGQGRTRDPSPPGGRVYTGPYARLEHPVYVANLLVAAGLVLAIAPPGPLAAIALIGVSGLYLVLSGRESAQIRRLPVELRPRKTVAEVARSERSTWVTVALLLLLAGL